MAFIIATVWAVGTSLCFATKPWCHLEKEEEGSRAEEPEHLPIPHLWACPDLKERCCAGRCQEPYGWAINLTHSERKIYTHSLETMPVADTHTHTLITQTHSCSTNPSSFAKTEPEEKVQSHEYLNLLSWLPSSVLKTNWWLVFQM